MKAALLFLALAATILVTSATLNRRTSRPPYINRPPPPPPPPRFRREANPQDHGSISVTREQSLSGPERRPSYNIDYQHKIWQGRNGEITAGGGAQKLPGQRWEPHVGVQGRWRFRREANPEDKHGSISISRDQQLSGPERRPSYKVDYQHNIWQGKNGAITAGGGAQKLPGQRWEPQVGVQGHWRFRREANPEDKHGSVSISRDQHLSGPERRPSYNIDYQHNIWQNKNGAITAGGGAQKLPGHRWEPQVGVQGHWRFRREANPEDKHGSVSISRDQHLSGPERRPSYNVDYQHNLWQSKNGAITAGGGAQKLPGHHWEPQVGVQGHWRFRREANPEDKHGSISISRDQQLSGPERRPSYKVDYQHNIWQGKNGAITAGGSAQKLPGQRWEPQVGVQGHWRFRREANPQKGRGSISATVNKPMSGPDRRPSYNIDYQHKIWQGKRGELSAGGGIQKVPGRKIEPQVGIQGRWRF